MQVGDERLLLSIVLFDLESEISVTQRDYARGLSFAVLDCRRGLGSSQDSTLGFDSILVGKKPAT